MGHGGDPELCDDGIQPDEPVPAGSCCRNKGSELYENPAVQSFCYRWVHDQKWEQQDTETFPADEKKGMVHRIVEFSRTHELAFCHQDLNPNDGYGLKF